MEVTARYKGGLQFEAEARGHRLTSDQPADNGGADGGMTPPELMMAALATCAGHYAAQYLNARNLPAEDLQVRVMAEKGMQPARLASFLIEVTAPGLDERHREGIARAAKACLIHNTLLHAAAIELRVHSAEVFKAL